jgi:hypothetical protein
MASVLDDFSSAGLFGIEAILPPQYWSVSAAGRGEPERRLMLAVLQDAVITLTRHSERSSSHSRRIVEEAQRWFASNSRAHPFAFAAICDVLGLDVDYVRAAIRRLHARAEGAPYRRDYAGRGRHQVERVARVRGLSRG